MMRPPLNRGGAIHAPSLSHSLPPMTNPLMEVRCLTRSSANGLAAAHAASWICAGVQRLCGRGAGGCIVSAAMTERQSVDVSAVSVVAVCTCGWREVTTTRGAAWVRAHSHDRSQHAGDVNPHTQRQAWRHR
jgi:hypothetical protein